MEQKLSLPTAGESSMTKTASSLNFPSLCAESAAAYSFPGSPLNLLHRPHNRTTKTRHDLRHYVASQISSQSFEDEQCPATGQQWSSTLFVQSLGVCVHCLQERGRLFGCEHALCMADSSWPS
ncbi:hypothetical protein K438DRAFT_254389 [Mycena galopus ATCC 62051]|nr:hypothetical protein K438DRAFT_254389 [Mycena galopus ATCC 62051]